MYVACTSFVSAFLLLAGAVPHVMQHANPTRMSPTHCFYLRLFHRYIIAIDWTSFQSEKFGAEKDLFCHTVAAEKVLENNFKKRAGTLTVCEHSLLFSLQLQGKGAKEKPYVNTIQKLL